MPFAAGCMLTPLRGYRFTVLFLRVVEILVLTHRPKARANQKPSPG
jgi:hypothetical protein